MDEELVARACNGDVQAFSALVTARLPRVYRVAHLILRDDDATADAVQDVLLAAWRDLPALQDPRRFDGWLYRLLVRRCRRAAVKRRTSRVRLIELTPDVEPTAADDQYAIAVRDELDRGFARLSTDHRAVVVLRHYLGLSLAETADALSVPVGTVQSRLNRAMQALRAALEADDRAAIPIHEVAQ
jgi:RNA polymerase sigma factor (sigma-70 family)